MGVKRLWEALESSNLIEQFIGNNNADIPVLARSLDDGPVFAVDLSMWILQAGQQADLQHLFSQEEAAAKVAFERVRSTNSSNLFFFSPSEFFSNFLSIFFNRVSTCFVSEWFQSLSSMALPLMQNVLLDGDLIMILILT